MSFNDNKRSGARLRSIVAFRKSSIDTLFGVGIHAKAVLAGNPIMLRGQIAAPFAQIGRNGAFGIQYRSWSKNQELDVLSKAMYHARELAMSRMRAEATAMGADGIVGVKLTIKRLEWDEHLLEFIAIGTGVVHGDGHKGFRAHDGGTFTSDPGCVKTLPMP